MDAVPAERPVTFPDPSTDATPPEVLHEPPASTSLNVVTVPTHATGFPEIAGAAPTVTTVSAVHPVGAVYVIAAVPPVTPVTIPDEVPTVAFVLPLIQVPPVVTSLKEVVNPWQTVGVPVIAAGGGLTVRVATA